MTPIILLFREFNLEVMAFILVKKLGACRIKNELEKTKESNQFFYTNIPL